MRIDIALLAGITLASAYASADDGWYVELNRHQTSLDSASTQDRRLETTCNILACSSSATEERYSSRFKNDGRWGAALGYANNSYRMEAEFRRNEFDLETRNERLELKALLFNLWRDFDLLGLNPYIGGGLGLGTMEQGSLNDNLVLGQLGFGVAYTLFDRFTADIGFRYLLAESDPVLEDDSRAVTRDIRADSWRLATRYHF